MNNENCKILQERTLLPKMSEMKFISDETLYSLCKTYGERARLWRQRFAGLLPEVFKRRLYERKGFLSIFEFAAKLAGMSREQVDIVLRLERKFEDKPILQKALADGEISANKLIRIASIATKENQEEIFEKAKILSNRALETLVRDVKNGGQKMHVHGNKSLNGSALKLNEDVENELIEMQEKGIDVNEFLREALKKRKQEIENEKIKIAEAQRLEQTESGEIEKIQKSERIWEKKTCMSQNQENPQNKKSITNMKISRYIPVKIKKIIQKEHGTECSVPGCARPAKTLHHTGRFALTKNHDPHFIAPLCEEHHELAHKIDLKYLQKSMWQ